MVQSRYYAQPAQIKGNESEGKNNDRYNDDRETEKESRLLLSTGL